jgi:hypothetical protein
MKGRKAFRFIIEIYQQEVLFLKNWTREHFEELLEVDSSNCGAMTVLKDGAIYIWVDKENGVDVGHLVHECVHAANFTLGIRGVKISTRNDETQAYLTQWIFQQCYNSLKGTKL